MRSFVRFEIQPRTRNAWAPCLGKLFFTLWGLHRKLTVTSAMVLLHFLQHRDSWPILVHARGACMGNRKAKQPTARQLASRNLLRTPTGDFWIHNTSRAYRRGSWCEAWDSSVYKRDSSATWRGTWRVSLLTHAQTSAGDLRQPTSIFATTIFSRSDIALLHSCARSGRQDRTTLREGCRPSDGRSVHCHGIMVSMNACRSPVRLDHLKNRHTVPLSRFDVLLSLP